MKILYLISDTADPSGTSGSSTHVREVIDGLENLGHNIRIIGGSKFSADRPKMKTKPKKNVPKILRSIKHDLDSIRKCFRSYRKLISEIPKFQPDLIYERAGYLNFSGWIAQTKFRLPRVLEINGLFTEERKLFGVSATLPRFSKMIESKISQNADLIFTVSQNLKDLLIERRGILSEKISVIHNGVNPETLKVDLQLLKQISEKYDLKSFSIVGFVGHVLPYHGIDQLISVAKKVTKKRDDVKFLIVGAVSDRLGLREMVEENRLTEKVIFTGAVPAETIGNYIENMSICVMPNSNPYNSPIKLFEYGFFAKAIIAPTTPAICEIMIDGEDGTLITAGDVSELRDAIENYLDHPAICEKHGRNFQRKVFDQHTWKKISDRTSEKLNQLTPQI